MKVLGSLTASLAMSVVLAQPTYLDEPMVAFRAQKEAKFVSGNGVYISPDDRYLISITNDCLVSMYDPFGSGEAVWEMMTMGVVSATSECRGGVAFNMAADPPYLVYMADDPNAGT